MMPPNGLAGKRAPKLSSAWPIEPKLAVRYIDTPRTRGMDDQVIVIVIEPTIDVGDVDGGSISGDICEVVIGRVMRRVPDRFVQRRCP